MRWVRPRGRLAPLAALGILLFAAGLVVAFDLRSHFGLQGIFDVYDEGIVLTDGLLVAHGAVPFHDFYTLYPPGGYYLVRWWWELFGVSVTSERLLGLMLHVGVAVLAGRLAGRARGGRFSWLAAGLVLLWLSRLGLAAFSWVAALLAALLWIELLCVARDRLRRRWWVAAGVALGCVGAFRDDLLLSLMLGQALAAVVYLAGVRRGPPRRDELRAGAWVLAGLLVPLLSVYGPAIADGGLHQMASDLYSYPIHDIQPARGLPMPDLLRGTSADPLSLRLPAFLTGFAEGGALLVLVGPAVALLGVLAARRGRLTNGLLICALGALTAAVIPQLVHRPDNTHAAYTVTPTLILVVALVESVAIAGRPLGLVAGLLALFTLLFPARHQLPPLSGLERVEIPSLGVRGSALGRGALAGRLPVIAYIDRYTRPGESIFSTSTDNARTTRNDMSIYFLADRPGATPYMQSDPGFTSRADTQRRIVADLRRRGTRLIVQYLEQGAPEPNASARQGSSLLDEYIAGHYRVTLRYGLYTVLARRATG